MRDGRYATVKGHGFQGEDVLRARMIEALMCDFRIDAAEMKRDFGATDAQLRAMFDRARGEFGNMVTVSAAGIAIPAEARPLTRMIARAFDAYDLSKAGHSPAV